MQWNTSGSVRALAVIFSFEMLVNLYFGHDNIIYPIGSLVF
jgi:hypothetical protein